MRLGCCGSMIAPATDPLGIEIVESLRALGFDYIELSATHLAELCDARFAVLRRRLAQTGLACEACNNFFPPALRLTGGEVDSARVQAHARLVMERASLLGAEVLVFGSSGAKNVPPGFSRETAWQQIVTLLRTLGELAAAHGLTLAVEPLCRAESNLVNRADEGLRLVREVDHPRVQLMIDSYHLAMEKEAPAIVLDAAQTLRHLHIACAAGRTFPVVWDEAFAPLFDRLRDINYVGRCSIEAFTHDFQGEARPSVQVLRDAMHRWKI